MKKKILAIAMVLTLIMGVGLMFTGCGGASTEDYSGVWKATSCISSGEEVDVTDVFDAGSTCTLNEDGTGTLTSDSKSADIEWGTTKDGIYVDFDDEHYEYEVDNGILTMAGYYNDVDVLFERVDPEDIEEIDPVGTWESTTCVYNGYEYEASDSFEGGITIEVKDNGVATVETLGEANDYIWEQTENGLKFTIFNTSYDAPINENGVLTLENFWADQLSGMDVNFVKVQ